METWLLNHPAKQERKPSNKIKTMEEIEAVLFDSVSIQEITASKFSSEEKRF